MRSPEGPSPFFLANADALVRAAALGPVLDLACGRGRHARAAARLGAFVLALDRDRDSLRALSATRPPGTGRVAAVRSDLETPHGLPLRPGCCGAVLIFRFLYRPLAPALTQVLRPGGLLLYETFTIHQRELGYGPKNPAFLLEPGELATLFPGLEIETHEETLSAGARPEALARLVARKPVSPTAA